MSFSIQFSNLAILDLEDIFDYTRVKWSLSQAEDYYLLLQAEFNTICTNPFIGKTIEEIKENHRCKPFRSHYIIYKVENETVFIDRILHQRMNITEVLND